MIKINEMILKYALSLGTGKNEGNISCHNIPKNEEEKLMLKNAKQEIIEELQKQKIIKEEQREIEEEKRIENYDFLKKQLPERNIISENNDEKAKKILSKISNSYFKNDPEMDGVNLSISASNGRVQKEAQKYCQHELETSFFHGYTGDARTKIERTISCKKCGLYIRDEKSEELSVEKQLSC
jgi:hypothetical protein